MKHQPVWLFKQFLSLMESTGSDFEGLHNYITDHYKLMNVENQGRFHELVSEHMQK